MDDVEVAAEEPSAAAHREVLQLRVPRREALSVAWHLVQVWWSAVRDGSQTVEITFGWDDPA